MEYIKDDQTIISNPYITQVDKFTASLQHLSRTFLRLESARGTFTKEEIEDIFNRVTDRVCSSCEKKGECLDANAIAVYQLVYEILYTVEEHGSELNADIRKKLQKKCIHAPRLLRESLEAFQEAKQSLLWSNRMAQNREGCATQLDTFAQMIQHATRELDASIFNDEMLEKKIKASLSKLGVRVLSTVFFMTPKGRYEVHITAKAGKKQCVATKDVARAVSMCAGRAMILEQDERPVLGRDYCTIICMEGPRYHTLQGVAKIGKGCSQISGDSFLMMELPGGKEGAILSDGMGSGEAAFKESAMVVEMLEELLEAGFPKETAVQMMNTALVMGREEVMFSTIDMSIFDLYEGTCEIMKVGASTTFVKYADRLEKIHSTSLPIGVLQELEVNSVSRQLSDGDFVVMVTDGVLDALPVGRQEAAMEEIINSFSTNNPTEAAHHILKSVLEESGEMPLDDMTVLVVGIWRR